MYNIQIKKSLTEIIVNKLNLIQEVEMLQLYNVTNPFVPQLFEELDNCNTGRITEDMFKELLHRLPL